MRGQFPRQVNPKYEALQTLKQGPLRITATNLCAPVPPAMPCTILQKGCLAASVCTSLMTFARAYQTCRLSLTAHAACSRRSIQGQVRLRERHTSLCVLLAAATAEAACCWSTSWRALSCCSCIVRATAQAFACTRRRQMAVQHTFGRRNVVAMNDISPTCPVSGFLHQMAMSHAQGGVAGGRGLSESQSAG